MTARLEHPMSKQECGSIGAMAYDEIMKERSRQLIAAAKERAGEPILHYGPHPERVNEIHNAWRDATALWIATHPKGEDAALSELSEVFSDE